MTLKFAPTPFASAAMAIAAIALPTTAIAGEPIIVDAPTTKVSTAGLDLNTMEGRKMLDGRIDRAAREICGYNIALTGSRFRMAESRKCVAKAKASTKQQVAALVADKRLGG
ncbi:MAG: UrcA family protein [Pseudomonadota bacterium]